MDLVLKKEREGRGKDVEMSEMEKKRMMEEKSLRMREMVERGEEEKREGVGEGKK